MEGVYNEMQPLEELVRSRHGPSYVKQFEKTVQRRRASGSAALREADVPSRQRAALQKARVQGHFATTADAARHRELTSAKPAPKRSRATARSKKARATKTQRWMSTVVSVRPEPRPSRRRGAVLPVLLPEVGRSHTRRSRSGSSTSSARRSHSGDKRSTPSTARNSKRSASDDDLWGPLNRSTSL